jgi:NodT family efflux transporter outer membrane factor (OMF) lipoprotein
MGSTQAEAIVCALAAALILAGCSLTPEHVRPSVAVPSAFSDGEVSAEASIAAHWWRAFGNATLSSLVEEANVANSDRAAAFHRAEQAKASYQIAGAALFPSIDVTADAAAIRDSQKGVERSFSGAALLAHDLDLFGGNRAATRSARATLAGRIFDYEAIKLSVQADVAVHYATLLLARDRLRISSRTLSNAEDILSVAETQFEAGATTMLDVVRQRSELALVRAARAVLTKDERVAENALAVLIGDAAGTVKPAGTGLAALRVPEVSPGVPAALIYRRPDVRRAEADLIAANADIGVARAALFPSLSLNLEAAFESDPVTTSLSIGSALLAPVFHGGRLRAGVRLSEARKAELVEDYKTTLLGALREVEDALAAVSSARRRFVDLAISVRESRNAYRQSRVRYEAGTDDFQSVLDAQRTLFEAEDSLALAHYERVIAAVQLIKALGGGWSEAKPTS